MGSNFLMVLDTKEQSSKGTKMKNYRNLIVWQKSMAFVNDIYKVTKDFPDDEKFGIISQIRRSAVSIPTNISEGYGRNSTNDYIRFLQISMGSLFETQTLLEISFNNEFLNELNFGEIFSKSREIERMLSSLIRSIKS